MINSANLLSDPREKPLHLVFVRHVELKMPVSICLQVTFPATATHHQMALLEIVLGEYTPDPLPGAGDQRDPGIHYPASAISFPAYSASEALLRNGLFS